LLKSAKKNGLAVTDREVAFEIRHNPAFRTDDRFDKSKYQNMLSNIRIDKLTYERDLRERLLFSKYYRFFSSGVLFSRKSVENAYKKFGTEMTIAVIEIAPDLFASEVKLTEKDITSYYESHKPNFQQKTQYVIKYVTLGVDDEKGNVRVRPKEVSKYYQKHKETEFKEKASFLSRHILIPIPGEKSERDRKIAEEKANRLYQQLKKNRKRFASLAKKYSKDPGSAAQGGDLGWVETGTFVKEFDETVRGMKKKELSRPFLSVFGYHIVELLDKKESVTQPFDKVEQAITDKIKINKAKRRLKSAVTRLLKKMESQSIDDVAASLNKKSVQTEPFDDGKEIPALGYSYQLYQTVKSQAVRDRGEYSLPGDQQVILYEIVKVIDPFVKPLKEVRESVTYYALAEKKRENAEKKFKSYSNDVKTVEQLEKLARSVKAPLKRITFKYSDQKIGDLNVGDNFRSEIFHMANGQVKAVQSLNKKYLVCLTRKKEGVMDENADERLRLLENSLRSQKARVLLGAMVRQMRGESTVEYNASLLKGLHIQFDS
jgi:parvulin-like peptidyl-prolyl isomerase